MAHERDNIKAGLFVLVGLVLALILVFILANPKMIFERAQQARIFFPLSDGLRGLQVGATVTLGHQPAGTVEAIKDVMEPTDGGRQRLVGKEVVISLPAKYTLYRNASIELVAPPLGSGTQLNIRSVGNAEPYESAMVLRGHIAPSPLMEGLAREAGIEDKQRQQLQQIITNLEAVTTTLRDDLPALTHRAREVLDQAQPVAQNANEAVVQLREAATNVNQITGTVRGQYEQWLERINRVLGAVNDTTGRLQGLVEAVDPQVRQSVDDLAAITHQVREKQLEQVTAALEKADAALANMAHATGELDTLITGQRPVLERAMANMQLTASQFKLAAVEIRRAPWRLLYRPSETELESDNLYDAARSFALAAGALDDASRSLQAVTQKNPDDTKRLEPMLDRLEALFSRFEEAEEEFWHALKKNGG